MMTGKRVRFANPNRDEDPNQVYVVIESDAVRSTISPTGPAWELMTIRPQWRVNTEDLVEVAD